MRYKLHNSIYTDGSVFIADHKTNRIIRAWDVSEKLIVLYIWFVDKIERRRGTFSLDILPELFLLLLIAMIIGSCAVYQVRGYDAELTRKILHTDQ